MFSLYLRGIPPGALTSSHSPKHMQLRLIGDSTSPVAVHELCHLLYVSGDWLQPPTTLQRIRCYKVQTDGLICSLMKIINTHYVIMGINFYITFKSGIIAYMRLKYVRVSQFVSGVVVMKNVFIFV